jgi:hypothetical protein
VGFHHSAQGLLDLDAALREIVDKQGADKVIETTGSDRSSTSVAI